MKSMTKNEIRSQMKAIRNQLPAHLRNEYNQRIHERLYGLKEFKACDAVFTYVSFGSEVDTTEIIDKAFGMNKKVYIPRVEKDDLNFYRIDSCDNLVRSKFGIFEPDTAIHQKYISDVSDDKKLMLLPGLAFDKAGNRVGYGAGYYDRYLGRYPHNEWIKIALAYDFQIMEQLTADGYDIPADYIVTADTVIRKEDSHGLYGEDR